jgi:hypothetical protein
MVGFGRSRKKSKEVLVPTSGPTVTPMESGPTGKEVYLEVLNLIKEDATAGGEAIQKRRRNSTPAIMQQQMDLDLVAEKPKVKLPGVVRADSSEAAEINELLKKGSGAVRERRMSKEALQPLAARQTPKKDSPKGSSLSPEAAEINRKIQEDRQKRRASKELQDAEKSALTQAEQKLASMSDEVRRAEEEAEAAAQQHDGNVADARARGAAKAAAARAGGVFHTKAEWQALKNAHEAEVASLEQKISSLQDQLEGKSPGGKSPGGQRGVLASLGSSFKKNVSTSFKRSKSPGVLRAAGTSLGGLHRQSSSSSLTSASGASFKKLFIKKSQSTSGSPNTKVAFQGEAVVLQTDREQAAGGDLPPTPSGGTVPPHVR